MCEFCGCSGVRTKQGANGIARQGKKRIAIPVVAISARSKVPKVSGTDFRRTLKTRPDNGSPESPASTTPR